MFGISIRKADGTVIYTAPIMGADGKFMLIEMAEHVGFT